MKRFCMVMLVSAPALVGCGKSEPGQAGPVLSAVAELKPAKAAQRTGEPEVLFEQQTIFTATVLATPFPATADYQAWTVDPDGKQDLRMRIDRIVVGDPPFVRDENVVFHLREAPPVADGKNHRFLLSHGVLSSGEPHVRVEAADAGSPGNYR